MGGLWVGKNSKVPNINGVANWPWSICVNWEFPFCCWPGGCFADDYHWRVGIGPIAKRPKRVNIHWGGYVEDNSFGTHEFIEVCLATRRPEDVGSDSGCETGVACSGELTGVKFASLLQQRS
jgi:alpha-L-arabinofuranosidase